MRRRIGSMGVLLTVLAVVPPAWAETPSGTVLARLGTLGLGLEYVQPLDERFAARIGLNGLDYNDSIVESGVRYRGELKLKNLTAIADFHPWEGLFRISAGMVLNGNEFQLEAEPDGDTFDFGGVSYRAEDVGSARGSVDFNDAAPYLGIGWGLVPDAETGLSFTADLGVLYQGEPRASLSATCGAALPPPQCSQLHRDVAREEVELQDALNDYRWFPVVSLGLGYRF